MAQVKAFILTEQVRVDARRVGDIVDELGEITARSVLEIALERMAASLKEAESAIQKKDLPLTIEHAEKVSRLAWQIGLVSLSSVALDLVNCARKRDETALSAVSARLMRVGNQSLTSIWDSIALE